MALFPKLCSIYQRRGYGIVSGLDMEFSHHHGTEYTWLFDHGRPATHHLGISLKELYFLECLFEVFHPHRLFAIGNSFGWSSLALAMLNPGSRLVVLESGAENFTAQWIRITNDIALEENLNLCVIQGRSPADVAAALQAAGIGQVDFAFIDGDHSERQIRQDFQAVRPHMAADGLMLFHDVLSWGLHPPLLTAATLAGARVETLPCTTSGMALVHLEAPPRAIREAVAGFSCSPAARSLARHFRQTGPPPAAEGMEAVLRSTTHFKG